MSFRLKINPKFVRFVYDTLVFAFVVALLLKLDIQKDQPFMSIVTGTLQMSAAAGFIVKALHLQLRDIIPLTRKTKNDSFATRFNSKSD